MNDFIILSDETRINIKDGGSLSNLQSIVATETDAIAVCTALSKKGNLAHVVFEDESGIYGEYHDLVLVDVPHRYNELDENDEPTGRVIVQFGFREKTEIERRLDELEETQAVQDMAIDDLANAVAEE